jgi:hypothetical protein
MKWGPTAPPRLPDTSIIREAAALLTDCSPPWVVAHSYRTSLWGHLLA